MTRLRFDRRGLRELERSPAMREALHEAGEAVAANAVAAMEQPPAPVRVSRETHGVRVTNTSPTATVEEWGSASREPLAPLRRGVKAAGLRLDEAG